VRLFAIAASTLAILLTIGLATHTRVRAAAPHEICNPTTGQMTGPSAVDTLLSGGIVQVVRAPQRKRSEPGSIVTVLNAEAGPVAPISCALATGRSRSEVSRVRFSRLQI